MSVKEQNDYPILCLHYRIAIATGIAPDQAKIYANAQIRTPTDIEHLKIN